MKKFKLVATVKRVIEDTIELDVFAENELLAYATAEKVLEVFPKEHKEKGVPFVYIRERALGEVTGIDINERKDG